MSEDLCGGYLFCSSVSSVNRRGLISKSNWTYCQVRLCEILHQKLFPNVYTLPSASLHSPTPHPLQSHHSSAQGRLFTFRTTHTRNITNHKKKITKKKKKSSSLTCVTYFFWLFRNLDLKSHSITCQGYAFPIHCSQLLLTFSPCWPTQVGLPAQLNSMGTVWARTSIFENPLQSAHTLEHFFHYPLENSPRR